MEAYCLLILEVQTPIQGETLNEAQYVHTLIPKLVISWGTSITLCNVKGSLRDECQESTQYDIVVSKYGIVIMFLAILIENGSLLAV